MEEYRKKEVDKVLAADHSELDVILSSLFDALDACDIEQIYERLDIFWARLAMHIRAEHLHLFPSILQAVESKSGKIAPANVVKSAIEQLQEDHNFFMRELTDAIKQIRVLREVEQNEKRGDLLFVREKISGVCKRLKAHNEREETEVYRWADTLLNHSEHAVLKEQIERELKNLPPRFAKAEEVF